MTLQALKWRRRRLQLPGWLTYWWEMVVRRRDRQMSSQWLHERRLEEETEDVG